MRVGIYCHTHSYEAFPLINTYRARCLINLILFELVQQLATPWHSITLVLVSLLQHDNCSALFCSYCVESYIVWLLLLYPENVLAPFHVIIRTRCSIGIEGCWFADAFVCRRWSQIHQPGRIQNLTIFVCFLDLVLALICDWLVMDCGSMLGAIWVVFYLKQKVLGRSQGMYSNKMWATVNETICRHLSIFAKHVGRFLKHGTRFIISECWSKAPHNEESNKSEPSLADLWLDGWVGGCTTPKEQHAICSRVFVQLASHSEFVSSPRWCSS